MLLPILILMMQHIAPPATTADREPQLATANSEVALVFGRGHKIMFSLSRDNGATFSKSRTIAELPVLPLSRPGKRRRRHKIRCRRTCSRSAIRRQSMCMAVRR